MTAPNGTIFTAEKPSPTGWYYEGVAQASDLVWKALAPLVPERFSAGSYLSLCATYFSGPGADGLFVHIEPQNGGWGATSKRDGASGMIAVTDGDTYNYSIELLEAKFPLLIRRYEYNVEGGVGAGRYRGGFGLVREYEIENDGVVLRTPVTAAPRRHLGPSAAVHRAVSTALRWCVGKRVGGSRARPIFRSTAATASASAPGEAEDGESPIPAIRIA